MPAMTDPSHTSETSDICLLLRAHGEQRWLIYQLVPVVREIEQDALPEEQLGAALAYLEALWIEARRRARETEAAFEQLDSPRPGDDLSVHEKARRYHAAVRRLRDALERRVDRQLAVASELCGDAPLADRYASS
jgi:hypothetical protein